MKSHPDFNRGRIRSKGESKKQLDQLWVQLSEKVNSAGCGPQKTPKEWAKTWRDWKSNVLKKVATYKSYASGTGGGPPKKLQTNRLEDDLLEFMSPDASGLSGIPEGGFESLENISCLNTQPSISSNNEIEEIDWMSNSFQESKNVDPMTEHFDVSTYEEGGYPAPKKIIIEGVTSLQKRVQQSATPAQPQESLPRKKSFLGKKTTNQTMISLLEKKTSTSEDFKTRVLEIKEEKLELYREKITLKKQHHQEVMNILGEIKFSIDECQNKINDIFGIQYLEPK